MADLMTFPDTWEEFEQDYGFSDVEQVYTNGSRLIQSFRVKQWLDHISAETKAETDTISRQAAIDTLETDAEMLRRVLDDTDLVGNERDKFAWGLGLIESNIYDMKELPSVQQEPPFEIQKILDYLDTALHPIISPEHWNVYSELHDMISTLQFAKPEPQWTPCSDIERLPEVGQEVLRTVRKFGWHGPDYWAVDIGTYNTNDGSIAAWMPLPEPYKGEQE